MGMCHLPYFFAKIMICVHILTGFICNFARIKSRPMVEFKDVDVVADGGSALSQVSFVLSEGQSLAVLGNDDGAKTLVFRAIMGLVPVAKGYVLIDGERITPASAGFFRKQMAYIPADLQLPYPTMADLVADICRLHHNKGGRTMVKSVYAEWKRLGLADDLRHRPYQELPVADRQMALLALAACLGKTVVMIGGVETARVAEFAQEVARKGAVVIAATDDEALVNGFDQHISLRYMENDNV